MANYTLKNFKTDIADGAAERGMSPDIESRMARSSIDSTELGVSYFRYGPGFRAPFGHSHVSQEEAYVVVEGSGNVKLDDTVEELKQWDVLRVAPDVVRGFEGGPEGMTLIAVGGKRPAEGDGQMVGDWWTD
jgi:quercetin dioxygenase-like cupin family protein